MKLAELKAQIIEKRLSNFYIITGTEIEIINIYINQIAKQNALEIVRKDTIAEVAGLVNTVGLFVNTPALYVVRGDNDFMKEDKSWDSFISLIGQNIVILLYDKIDSRLKFGKHFKDSVVEVEKLLPNIVMHYVLKEFDGMSSECASYLVKVCNGSYDICMRECEKIKDYMSATRMKNPNNATKKLLEDGTIYQSQDADVFQLSEAVCGHNLESSLELARILTNNGVSSITALGTIYNSLKAVMLMQCCNGDIAETTGLDKGAIWYNKKYIGKYDIYDLVYAVRFIAQTVTDIKNGLISDDIALKYTLISIM